MKSLQNDKKQPLNNSDDRVKKVDLRRTSARKKSRSSQPAKTASKIDLKKENSNEHNNEQHAPAPKRRSVRQRRSKHNNVAGEEAAGAAEPPPVAAAPTPHHQKRAASAAASTSKRTARNTKRQHAIHVAASPSKETVSKRKLLLAAATGRVEDKMPEALKVVKLDVEERTCARTRKKKKEMESEKLCFTQEEPTYSDDVINNENGGKLFDEHRQPFWTLEIFNAEEAEKEGIEVEGRITAEHVLKYLEGTLAPVQPPDTKYSFDWLKSVDEMRAVDDAFFSEDAIMYHTLRNIISSENALKRCTESGQEDVGRNRSCSSKLTDSTKKSESFEDLQPTIRFSNEEVEKVTYSRDKPMETIRKYLKIKENLRKWDAMY